MTFEIPPRRALRGCVVQVYQLRGWSTFRMCQLWGLLTSANLEAGSAENRWRTVPELTQCVCGAHLSTLGGGTLRRSAKRSDGGLSLSCHVVCFGANLSTLGWNLEVVGAEEGLGDVEVVPVLRMLPHLRNQIVCINCLGFYCKAPDSGERQYRSRN